MSNFAFSGILALLLTLSGRKEVFPMEILGTFVISIAASVIAYYICKWLDGEQ